MVYYKVSGRMSAVDSILVEAADLVVPEQPPG
jgi:hypothetical protein